MGVIVSERAEDMEGRMENYQQQIEGKIEGLQMGLESMKKEFQRVQNIEKNITTMMEQFGLLMERWEDKEEGEIVGRALTGGFVPHWEGHAGTGKLA